jgi:hypothetical protein
MINVFIEAKVWDEMSSTEIIDSIDIAVRVLKDKEIESVNDVRKLLLIISDIAEMLSEMATIKEMP